MVALSFAVPFQKNVCPRSLDAIQHSHNMHGANYAFTGMLLSITYVCRFYMYITHNMENVTVLVSGSLRNNHVIPIG